MSRSVSAPSSVTYTSPCWNGLIVPGSTFRYGSNFCNWTRRPLALSRRPRDAATIPLPSADTTPPVTKTYFGARALTGFQGSRMGGRRYGRVRGACVRRARRGCRLPPRAGRRGPSGGLPPALACRPRQPDALVAHRLRRLPGDLAQRRVVREADVYDAPRRDHLHPAAPLLDRLVLLRRSRSRRRRASRRQPR